MINNWIYRLKSGSIKNNRLDWPFLVQFGLNLGLNNLKFGQEAILQSIWSNWVDLIKSIWSSLFYRVVDRVNSTAKMASWPNFKLFRPKLSPNQNKNGKNWKVLSVENDYDKNVHFGIFRGKSWLFLSRKLLKWDTKSK